MIPWLTLVAVALVLAFILGIRVGYAAGMERAYRAFRDGMKRGME